MLVTTAAVVQYRVQTGISKNHCSSGNWPGMPPSPPAPRTAAIFARDPELSGVDVVRLVFVSGTVGRDESAVEAPPYFES